MPSIRHAVAAWLVVGALTLEAHAADIHRPQPFNAVYAVKVGRVTVGRMTRQFTLDENDGYRFSSVIEAEGLLAMLKPTRIAEESSGRWADAHPTSLQYLNSKQSGKKMKETRIDFDWAASRSHATVNGTPVDGALAPGTIDKLNYQLVVMRDLAAGVTTLAYEVADVGGAKHHQLERRANESVPIGGRHWDTVPIVYARDDGRRTVLWCAPELDFLPVRIEYTEKDGTVSTAELRPPQ